MLQYPILFNSTKHNITTYNIQYISKIDMNYCKNKDDVLKHHEY